MADAGEGLIDAEDRFQERMAEREQERRRSGSPAVDPARERARKSLTLAQAELRQQAEATSSPVRRQQIVEALADLQRRLAGL